MRRRFGRSGGRERRELVDNEERTREPQKLEEGEWEKGNRKVRKWRKKQKN